MSAHTIIEQRACANCAAPWDVLIPKGSNEADVYYCQCADCGHKDTYVFPRICLECDTPDWADHKSGDYPEDCPFCGAVDWGMD